MPGIRPFILNELPTTYVPSALYFIQHPLTTELMTVYLASKDGTSVSKVYTPSPIAVMEPELYDATSFVYAAGDLTAKKFLLDSVEVGEITFQYTAGDLTSKKLYLGGNFVAKITFTYVAGDLTGTEYSTVE